MLLQQMVEALDAYSNQQSRLIVVSIMGILLFYSCNQMCSLIESDLTLPSEIAISRSDL